MLALQAWALGSRRRHLDEVAIEARLPLRLSHADSHEREKRGQPHDVIFVEPVASEVLAFRHAAESPAVEKRVLGSAPLDRNDRD